MSGRLQNDLSPTVYDVVIVIIVVIKYVRYLPMCTYRKRKIAAPPSSKQSRCSIEGLSTPVLSVYYFVVVFNKRTISHQLLY